MIGQVNRIAAIDLNFKTHKKQNQMTARNRTIKEYNEDYSKTLEISVYYDSGGMNFFQGVVQKRGYYIAVVPVEVTKHNGYEMVSFTAFTGTKKLVEEANRYSEKVLHTIKDKAKDILPALIEHVIAKNNIVKKELLQETN